MKVGILTFHRVHNYGALLQAYALQTILEVMGHEVSFVDYELPEMLGVYKWYHGSRSIINKSFFTIGLKNAGKLLRNKRRFDCFNRFIKTYLNESERGIDNLDEQYDVIVVGSDQVFNIGITGLTNNAYWGVLPSFSNKIISYAASTVLFKFTEEHKIQIPMRLERFSKLSVREDFVANFFRQFTDNDIIVSLDPTLLLNKETWNKIVVKPKIRKKYLFYYYVRSSDISLDFAKRIAKEKKLDLVIIGSYNSRYSTPKAFCSGPKEFLGWIKYADYVISSSFHCTVFSLIFNKQFSALSLQDGKDGRISTLLKKMDLENRIVTPYEEAVVGVINWNAVNEKIENLSEVSLDYLKENIS